MARPRKKILQKDISRNSSIKITGTINKIKANERKYTICLVIIFMALFTVIGYFTLKINVTKYDEYLKKGSITLYSKVVALDETQVFSDQDGLKTDDYSITIYNGIEKEVRYRILLRKDETLTNLCDCRDVEIKPNNLRISFDGDIVTYNDFNDIVIDTGVLKEYEDKTITVKVWLSEDTNTHFHGRFILERID